MYYYNVLTSNNGTENSQYTKVTTAAITVAQNDNALKTHRKCSALGCFPTYFM